MEAPRIPKTVAPSVRIMVELYPYLKAEHPGEAYKDSQSTPQRLFILYQIKCKSIIQNILKGVDIQLAVDVFAMLLDRSPADKQPV